MRLTLMIALTQRLRRLVNPDMHMRTDAHTHVRTHNQPRLSAAQCFGKNGQAGQPSSKKGEGVVQLLFPTLYQTTKVGKEAVHNMSLTWL